uniref:Lipoprotein n=1 Tax=Parastrongyloides trichosuri TaxID=131310 RepID=A0A0N4Z8R2_PARTI
MLFYIFQIFFPILIGISTTLFNCARSKKDQNDCPEELKKQIVLSRAKELNDQDTYLRTKNNELIALKEEIQKRKSVKPSTIFDNVGCTPFPTPITTPVYDMEIEAIKREREFADNINYQSPQVFRV